MVLGQYFPHIETNQLICTKNQFTGLSMWQKQLPQMFYKKRHSQKFLNIHDKTTVLESPFNKVAGLQDLFLMFLSLTLNK